MKTFILLASFTFTVCSISAQDIDFNAFPDHFDDNPERYEALKKVLGAIPTPPPMDLDTLEVIEIEGGVRLKIEYTAELADTILNAPIDRIQAYLFVPEKIDQKLPAVVAIHQDGSYSHIGKLETAGLAGDDDMHYGLELFQRGYVVISPDRYHHAVRRRIPRPDTVCTDEKLENRAHSHWVGQLIMQGRTHTGKEVYDNMLAVNVLATYDFVDMDRIGAIGHSGGGNALVPFMFYDKRIKVGVSSCGFFETVYWFHENAARKRSSLGALPGLLDYGIKSDYLAFIAPRPIMLTRGLYEWGDGGKWGKFSKLDVVEYQLMDKYAGQAYSRFDQREHLNFLYFDEAGGRHAMPPKVKETAYSWIDRFLKKE